MSEFASIVFSVTLFLGTLLALVVGHSVGSRRIRGDTEGARVGLGAVEGAVFGLMGLLIAFTFSGAAARFDDRRELIIGEANAIGTAWMRLDLLGPEQQPKIRTTFRNYLDARLAIYRSIHDPAAALQARAESLGLANQLWVEAVAAVLDRGIPQVGTLVLPALNEMFDIATVRTEATQMHPPMAIYAMLYALTLVSALLAGFAMAGGKRRSWLHMLGFSLVMAASVYIILDLEFPRRGLIRTDGFDGVLVDLRKSMD